jgi:transcriptional regulator with XRE-family HTH domain
MSAKVIIKAIKTTRVEKKMSQEEMAAKSGIPIRSYQRIESGESIPRLDVLFRICNVLGVDARKLFFETFEQALKPPPTTAAEQQGAKNWHNKNRQSPMLVTSIEVEGLKKSLTQNYEMGHEKVGYWEFNITSGEFFWSSQMFEIYQLEPGEFFDSELFRSHVNPDDLKIIDKSIELLVKSGVQYRNTHRYFINNENYRIRSIANLFESKDGHKIIFGIAERID